MVRFIGDIHGDVLNYAGIIDGVKESVQVGDFGVGFIPTQFMDELHADGNHKFIRGNHDKPSLCKERPGYIEDGTWDEDRSIMYVGGAWSIDWPLRVASMDRGGPECWWRDEELDDDAFELIEKKYNEVRPRIMVTHDAPSSIAREYILGPYKKQHTTRTAVYFESMFKAHQPDIWIFGHWHENVDTVNNGTRFICVDINNYIDLEV